MTIRIAVIGDLAPTSPAGQEMARTAQLLAPVELVRLDHSTPDSDWEASSPATGATAYDGLWFVTPAEGQAPSEHEAAAYAIGHRLVAQGMPVLTVSQSAIEPGTHTGPVPEPDLHAFLGGARWHAQTRAKREVAAARATEEARPRTYVHQLKATAHRWWRPVITLLVFSTAWLLIAAAVGIPFAVLGQLPEEEDFALSTGTNLWMNLILAAFIPAGMIATRVGGWRPWGRLFSVTGRLRWGWLLRCMALITPLWLLYFTVNWFVYNQEVMARPKDWVGLLVVALLTTPLQAAGEEVAFRGVLVQAVGAWFAADGGIGRDNRPRSPASAGPTARWTSGSGSTSALWPSRAAGSRGAPVGWRQPSRAAHRQQPRGVPRWHHPGRSRGVLCRLDDHWVTGLCRHVHRGDDDGQRDHPLGAAKRKGIAPNGWKAAAQG